MNKRAYILGYRDAGKLEKIAGPVMDDSWNQVAKVTGEGIGGTVGNLALYSVPFVGDARMGYDALSDYANMFGKGLSAKQRLGYGLSGSVQALFAAMGFAAGGMTAAAGGIGSTPVTWAGKGLAKIISKLTRSTKAVDAIKRAHGAYRRGGQGLQRVMTTKAGKPGKFLFGKNPYEKGFKRFGYGAARIAPPIATSMYAGSMVGEDDKQNQAQHFKYAALNKTVEKEHLRRFIRDE